MGGPPPEGGGRTCPSTGGRTSVGPERVVDGLDRDEAVFDHEGVGAVVHPGVAAAARPLQDGDLAPDELPPVFAAAPQPGGARPVPPAGPRWPPAAAAAAPRAAAPAAGTRPAPARPVSRQRRRGRCLPVPAPRGFRFAIVPTSRTLAETDSQIPS